ncbi:MAG: alpha/beta fold hydrolase [Candidatus Eremiobacteraeota bacterium]|nr:alpha/beta fold hydrolase [Candidatus Eremiobacteraeota bacterium]
MNVQLRYLPVPRGTIAALDYEPRRPRGIAVAVAHGYSSSKHNLDVLCAFLASHGFSVLSVDFPGHKLGASGGVLSSIDDLTDTLTAAARYAREHYSETVYTCGHSMGATTALRVCAGDPQVAGAIAIATGWGRPSALDALATKGVVDLRGGYVNGLGLPEIVAATEPLLEGVLSRLGGRPCLYVAAERDMMVSQRSVAELFARAPEPKTFETIPSDHTYAGEHARAAVLAWLGALHPREGQRPRAEPVSAASDPL